MTAHPQTSSACESVWLRWYAVAFGVFLGLAFLKFPNPPVLEHLAVAPNGIWEWLLTGWPVRYAYPLLGGLILAGLWLIRWPGGVSWWQASMPLLWLGWVALSCIGTLDGKLSRLTLMHFVACLACFYLGLLVLSRVRQPAYLFAGMIGALALVMLAGWEQHFGGLERTRNFFNAYIQQTQVEMHPDLLKRMQSNRIFGTLFYPNSLAGVILLVAPVMMGLIADGRTAFTAGARRLLAGMVLVGAVGCLVWSGSKGGWLLAMLGGLAVLLRLPLRKRSKVLIIAALLVAGAAGFVVRFLGFFERGATSVVARFDYWGAAVQNIQSRPLLGSGPGTFAKVYAEIKPPEAEMTRLAHNDYLQQASDSGIPAGLFFLAMVGVVLWAGGRGWQTKGWTEFGVGLGVALLAIQSLSEFGFYIPATAWCWFALGGWLLGRCRLTFDKAKPPP